MKKFYLMEKIIECLSRNPEQKFTGRDIAQWIFKEYPRECQEKKERSPKINNDQQLVARIAGEISSKISYQNRTLRRDPKIGVSEETPRRYYYTVSSNHDEVERSAAQTSRVFSSTNSSNHDEVERSESSSSGLAHTDSDVQTKIKEYELYQILTDFLGLELNVYSKRIDEKRSKNSSGQRGNNRWLYPDLVGMEDLSKDWHQEIKECARLHSDKKAKLWSFEVKRAISRANVREVFFQTVSNSSWANFAYLVADTFSSKESEALRELRLLSSLHGVGFIKLDTENPYKSQIMIPAKEKINIDWDNANRLAKENKDFSNYIKSVRHFYQTNSIMPSEWDTISRKN